MKKILLTVGMIMLLAVSSYSRQQRMFTSQKAVNVNSLENNSELKKSVDSWVQALEDHNWEAAAEVMYQPNLEENLKHHMAIEQYVIEACGTNYYIDSWEIGMPEDTVIAHVDVEKISKVEIYYAEEADYEDGGIDVFGMIHYENGEYQTIAINFIKCGQAYKVTGGLG